MVTFDALPLEICYMIAELALPDLAQTSSRARYTAKKAERDYYKAVFRIATISRSLLTSVCWFIESLQRQEDAPTWTDECHNAGCKDSRIWLCEKRRWCLLEVILQRLLRVSRIRERHDQKTVRNVRKLTRDDTPLRRSQRIVQKTLHNIEK